MSTSSGGGTRQITRTVDGRAQAAEKVEERVVSDSGGVKVIEKIVRRPDPNGNLAIAEKVQIEERTQAGGAVQISTTKRTPDASGNFALTERSVAVQQKAGDRVTTTVNIERPGMSGTLQLAERVEQVQESAAGKTKESSTVYRRDGSGQMREAAKDIIERTEQNGQTIANAARYSAGGSGQLELVRQTVSRTAKEGSAERTEVDVFETSAAGRAFAQGESGARLTEQQVIEKRPAASGVVESVSVRTPLDNDPKRFGNWRKVQETVCTGDCAKR